MNMSRPAFRRIAFFLAILGPGLITGTVDNDAGGIATYSFAGGHFGYALLWTMIPITALLIFVLDTTTRMAVVTRVGFGDLIRERFRVKWTMLLLALVLIVNIGTTTSEFAGIASSFRILGGELGLDPAINALMTIAGVVVAAVAVWLLVVKGTYAKVEKVFLLLVGFYVAYIASAIMARPDWGQAVTDIVVPRVSLDPLYLFTIVGIIGTTVTPWMNFYLHASLVEKGIKTRELKYARIDSIAGALSTFVVAFFIIVAAAATIHKAGLGVGDVESIAHSLVPLAGKYAGYLFAFGLLNASFFAAAILPLATAFAICEALGWELGVNKQFHQAREFYAIFTGMIVIGAGIVIFPQVPLLTIMRVSQVANGVLLPLFLVYLLLLAENKELLGKHRNRGFLRFFGWLCAGVLTVLNILLIASPFG